MILQRHDFLPEGIFGTLRSEDNEEICKTLEHAYGALNGLYLPKIPSGNYICVRGMHRLASMNHDFETFEVIGVFGHTGLLFHAGNTNDDSHGCILVGEVVQNKMILRSLKAFATFMESVKGVNAFNLVVC